jgi:hypothetical protein
MEPTTPLKAKSPDEAYPLEPFLAPGLPAGTMIGAGSTDPQYQPGTPEYALRSNDQFRAVNRTLFDTFESAEKAASTDNAAAVLDRKDESAKNPVIRSFISNVKSVLPEGSGASDAAWYVLNTLRPQVKHDAKYVFGKIRPIIQAKMAEAKQSGSSFYPADMTNEDILGIAKQAGVDPSVVARMVGEESELTARKATKTYTMGVLRPMVDMLDINSMYGQQVYNDPVKELAGLTGPARRDAFLAMARWKEYHGESFLGGIVEGISTLIVDAGYAAGGFVEGGIGTMTTLGTGGQYLMENDRTVLSNDWIQKPKEYQDEANSVLQRAHELAKKYGPELASAAGDEEKFAATLEGRFGQYGDKEEIRTFRRLSELRAEGAYRNQLSVERLANFGEGVLNAVPNMVKLFNSSIDPNSVFFRTEDNIKNNPLNSYLSFQALGVNSVLAPAYEGWVKGTKHYQEMQGERLDKSIDLFLENYRDMQGDGESVVGFFYRKSAEATEALGGNPVLDPIAKNLGLGSASEIFRAGQKAAGGMLQEKELIQAAALADPVMTVLGAMKLLGVGAKAAAASKALNGVRAGLQEVTAEAVALRASANTTSKVFDTAVAELRVQLEAALPGAKFTDDDVIGIAIGDRKSLIGRSASAQVVRKEIGGTIAKNKGLAKRVGDLTKQLDELPDDVAGIEKLRARPVGGSVITASGYTAQGVSVPFNALANFLDVESSTAKGFSVRRFLGTASRKVLSVPVVGSAATTALIGGFLIGGEIGTAALFSLSAGIGTSTVGFLIRPDTLRLIGGKMAQAGRIQRAIGANISKGQQYGESTFLRSAMDMEVEARKLFATVPMTKGAVRTAKQEADLARATLLADDAQQLRRLHKSGMEDVMMTASRVVWEDGLVAGGTGALIAGLNDNDATGAGAGMAIGFSTTFRGLNRLHQVTPKGADPVHARIILGDVATIAQQVKDPVQRANMLAFLGDAGADSAAYIRRAGIVRDLYVSLRGQVRFVRGTEFEAATILTGSPEVEANMVQNEAAGIHPGDPVKARAYAEERLAKLKASREAKDRATYLKTKVEENKVNIDNLNRSMAAVDADIAKQQAIVDDERVNFTDIKKADANKIQLDKLLQRKSELQANLEVAANQSTVLEGDYGAALGESKVDIPFRPYESRLMPDGSTARSVASGFYVIDGPQGRSVTVNIDSIDNIAAVSEGMHALLADSAAESLMPEMVRMLFEETGDSSGRAVAPAITNAILQAYGDSLTPAQRARFMAEGQNGIDIYEKSGKKDISAIVDPLREAMTWMLASVDMSKRPGYRPDLASVASGRTNMASATGWDAVRKTLFGDRTLSDNVNTALKNMFDPVYGSFTRKNAAHIVSQLEASGMRFVESGDGTLRGYFLNENNEIVRSAVLDAFYDKLIVKTGGEGSSRIRPINLYDPMIPVEQRIDFIKRNGLDWVLDDNGGIMTPEQIGVKSDGFIRSIEDGLNAIPEGERGMQVYTDEKGNVIRTGVPTQIEIAAIANNPNVPQSYKDNLLTVMKTIGSGEIKSVLSAEYSNIFSVNTEALTAHRLRVGKDIAGKTETRNIIPLAFTMGEAPIYGADGKTVKVKDPVTGKMVEAKQRVIRLRAFDSQAFQRSVNQSFSGGLYVLDDAGKRSFLKDPEGKDYTATYLRSLFGTDADFHNAAGLWMQHYQRAGALDPTAGVPMKDGAPRENNPVSAEVLDPINPVRGAAMRDALRVIFQLESGKKRLGWVEANRQTNTANGFAIRGTNFPISDFRLDQFGPLKENGQSMPIDLVGVTSGAFAMGVKGWGSHKPQIINGVPGMVVKTVFEAGTDKFLQGNDINVTEVRVHPSLPDVKVFMGYEVKAGTKQKISTIAYTIGDGKIINSNSSDMRLVMQEIKKKIYGREDANYIDSILNQWRYDSQKPLPGTLAAPAKVTGPTDVGVTPKSGADMIDTLNGLYAAEAGGKDIPPSLRKYLNEQNVEADIANGKSLFMILNDLQTNLKGEMSRTSSRYSTTEQDRLRGIIDHLDTAASLVGSSSRKYRAAYEVPTRDLKTDTIRTVFDLGRPVNDVGGWSADGLIANELFRVSKEFASDQFKNNKEYLEAVIAKLDEEMFNAADLEGEPFRKEMDRLKPAKEKAERALEKLKKNSPELWEAAPADAGAPALEGETPVEKFESALKQKNLRILKYRDDPSGFEQNGGIVDGGRRLPTLVVGDTKVGFTSAGMELVNNVVQIMDDVDVDASGNVIYTIDRISTPSEKRGKGSASKALSEITSAADKAGLTIQLEPTVMKSLVGDGASLNKAQLIEWYKKNGFVPRFEGSDKILIRTPKEPAPAAGTQPAATPEQPAGRDVTPRAGGPGDETTGRTPAISPKEQASQFTEGTGRDAPYMTPEEIARTAEFRVGPDGKITRITEPEKTERQRWQERYKAILNKRKEEAAQAKDTLNENEKRRRAMVNQVRDRAAAEIDAIEKRAAYWRSEAQKQAQVDAKAAKAAQKEADQLQAQADARRIAFERGIGDARATADAKNAQTNKLLDIALSSNQPLIAPGLLLVDANRLTVQPFRMALPTDTAVTPAATTRTGILYLRNVSGFESNVQAFQQSFFNYLHGDAIGRGQAIAGEAFRGPMAAQQGINLINTRMWVAEKSGGRLLREYRNADKASGRDIVTYKVYGANGMLIKQSNDAADAIEAISNLEERFMNTAGIGVLKPDAAEAAGFMLDAYTSKPATGRPKAKVQKTEEDTMRIQNLERYRGVEAAR